MTPTFANGKICYILIPTTDVDRSAAFYESVFGWHIRRRGEEDVAFDDSVGQVSGAWVTGRPPAREPGLLIFIMVEDAGATIEAIVAHGGEIVQRIARDAPEITAQFRDPVGNLMGLYQERSLSRASPQRQQ